MLLLVMMISMLSIYHVVKKSYDAIGKVGNRHYNSHNSRDNHNSRLINIAMRLLLLLMCNLLTWVPFMIVSVLLLGGSSVHENVQQWVVVLGLPLCASTDPILYNLAALKTYLSKVMQNRKTGTITIKLRTLTSRT